MAIGDFFSRGDEAVYDSMFAELETMRDNIQVGFRKVASPVQYMLGTALGTATLTLDGLAQLGQIPGLAGYYFVVSNVSGAVTAQTGVDVYLEGNADPVDSFVLTADAANKNFDANSIVKWSPVLSKFVVVVADGSPTMFSWTPAGGEVVETPVPWATTFLAGASRCIVYQNWLIGVINGGTNIIALLLTDTAAATTVWTATTAKTTFAIESSTALAKLLVMNTDGTYYSADMPSADVTLTGDELTLSETVSNIATTGWTYDAATEKLYTVGWVAADLTNYLISVTLNGGVQGWHNLGPMWNTVIGLNKLSAFAGNLYTVSAVGFTKIGLASLVVESFLDIATITNRVGGIPVVLPITGEIDDGFKKWFSATGVIVKAIF